MKRTEWVGTTRRKIVELYKRRGPLMIREIAEELNLTGMAVRRHVLHLQADGYLEVAEKRGKAHRPAMVHRLTQKAAGLFPQQYGMLALELLEGLQELGGKDAICDLFLRQKEKSKRKLLTSIGHDELEGRIHALASYQNERGYMVSLYKSEDQVWVLEEANCPILQIAVSYPHACQCEMALFTEVLGTKVQRMSCMAEGGRICQYRIMNTEV